MSETVKEPKAVKKVDPVKSAEAKERALLTAQKKERMVQKHLETLKRASTKKGDTQDEFINAIAGIREAQRTAEDWQALVEDGTFKQAFVDKILDPKFDLVTEKKVYKSKATGLPRQPKGPDPVFGYACVRKMFGVETIVDGKPVIVPSTEPIPGELVNEDKTVTAISINATEAANAGVAVRTAMDAILVSPEYKILEAAGLDLEPYWRNLNNQGQGGPRSVDATEVVTSSTEEAVA